MYFHSITVSFRSGMRPKGLKKLINSVGGLHRTGNMTETYLACATLSKHPAIERVVLTHVTESNAGVWRKGKRSV